MTGNNDGLCASRDESRNFLDHDGLRDNCALKFVSDGAVWALPHFLKTELLDANLNSCDGGALNAELASLDGMSSIKSDLIVGGITILDAQVDVLNVNVEVGRMSFSLMSC